jgi:hypothetical protein
LLIRLPGYGRAGRAACRGYEGYVGSGTYAAWYRDVDLRQPRTRPEKETGTVWPAIANVTGLMVCQAGMLGPPIHLSPLDWLRPNRHINEAEFFFEFGAVGADAVGGRHGWSMNVAQWRGGK